jgi:hypothetical protein
VKVNIGCGDRYAPGWVNVDRADTPTRKDLDHDLRNPMPRKWIGKIERAYAGHVLEHMFVDEVIVFLQRLREAMHPEGELMVVGPDVIRAQGMLVAGAQLEVPFNEIRHGGDRWPGDTHRWDCTANCIKRLLIVTGWMLVTEVGIQNVPEEWPVAVRGPRWQCAVSARPGTGPFHDFDS